MQKASEKIYCPTCGNKVQISEYVLGGGQADCFTCRSSIRVLPHKDGFIISKHIYPAYVINGRHRGPVLTDYIITETKLPTILSTSSPEVRHLSKNEVTA